MIDLDDETHKINKELKWLRAKQEILKFLFICSLLVLFAVSTMKY